MFHVYLLASQPRGTLYVGVTSDLVRRVDRGEMDPGFRRDDKRGVVWHFY